MGDTLQTITNLAAQQQAAELRVQHAEAALKNAKIELAEIAERLLPDALDEAGVWELILAGGKKLALKQEIYASIPKSELDNAIQWLTENGHADIIKHKVLVEFGKGNNTVANNLAAQLERAYGNVKNDVSVHPQTLRALCRELLEAGEDLPMETLGVRRVRQTTIK